MTKPGVEFINMPTRRRKRKRTITTSTPSSERCPKFEDVVGQLTAVVAGWDLPTILAHKVVSFCCCSSQAHSSTTTVIQVAGSGTLISRGVFSSATEIEKKIFESLGEGTIFTVFTDVSLKKQLKRGKERAQFPRTLYVRIDATAEQCKDLVNWAPLKSYGQRRPRTRPVTSVTSIKRPIPWAFGDSFPIPTAIGVLRRLRRLKITYSPVCGCLPSEIGGLGSLRMLHLHHCKLTGRIPTEIGKLGKLEELHLLKNNIVGPIPTELGNLACLTSLQLGGMPTAPEADRLSGPIPTELGFLCRLELITMYFTNVTGPIPTELGQLRYLQSFFMYGCQVTGPPPHQWEAFSVNVEVTQVPSPLDLHYKMQMPKWGWSNFR